MKAGDDLVEKGVRRDGREVPLEPRQHQQLPLLRKGERGRGMSEGGLTIGTTPLIISTYTGERQTEGGEEGERGLERRKTA